MEEIVIPSRLEPNIFRRIAKPSLDLDDDEDDHYALPSLARSAFGSASSSTPESDKFSHRSNPSQDSYPTRLATPTRPPLPKVSASYSVGVPISNGRDGGGIGKLSNGSTTSLAGPGTSIGSSSSFLGNRKGSLASLRNAFNKSASASTATVPVPPVPALDVKQVGGSGYPALKNPFSRFESPFSPTASSFNQASRNGASSPAPSGFEGWRERKQSIATNHSSQRSQGGRSTTSQGSSNFRADDYPMPALPPIPMRATQSRSAATESDSPNSLGLHYRTAGRHSEEGNTPADAALRIMFRDLEDIANQKIARFCARPLVRLTSWDAHNLTTDRILSHPYLRIWRKEWTRSWTLC